MFENRHVFNGKINGQTINDFTLDYSFSDLDSRLDYLIELLDKIRDDSNRNFFEAYFDNYFKVISSVDDNLSDRNNICRRLELMADYLLRSTEIRADRKSNETKYYFYVSREEFIKRTKNEIAVEGATDGNVIHFLAPKQKNTKKAKVQKITRDDLERTDYIGEVLSQYQDYLNILNENIAKGFIAKRRGSAIKGLVNDDMLRIKDLLLGVFGYTLRNPIAESTMPSWDMFDYTNPEHIKFALNITRELDPNCDLSHICLDLDMALKTLSKSGKLTARQIQIINLYRQGYGFSELSKELNVTTVTVYKLVKTVSKKIAKYYKSKGV